MSQHVIASHDAHLVYVPFSELDLADSRYRFRWHYGPFIDDMRAGLKRSGQTHPALFEQTGPHSYRILDGHRRVDAVRSIRESGGSWEKLLAHVIPEGRLSPLERFHLLRERNLSGKDPFGMIERGRFFSYFIEQGLTAQEISRHCGINGHDVTDFMELAHAPAELGWLLNKANLEPAFALMLARRYHGWKQTAHSNEALLVAQRLVGHAQAERVTMKGWRFLLDFYWPHDRPFLAKHS